jgi:hypothetical protein
MVVETEIIPIMSLHDKITYLIDHNYMNEEDKMLINTILEGTHLPQFLLTDYFIDRSMFTSINTPNGIILYPTIYGFINAYYYYKQYMVVPNPNIFIENDIFINFSIQNDKMIQISIKEIIFQKEGNQFIEWLYSQIHMEQNR